MEPNHGFEKRGMRAATGGYHQAYQGAKSLLSGSAFLDDLIVMLQRTRVQRNCVGKALFSFFESDLVLDPFELFDVY